MTSDLIHSTLTLVKLLPLIPYDALHFLVKITLDVIEHHTCYVIFWYHHHQLGKMQKAETCNHSSGLWIPRSKNNSSPFHFVQSIQNFEVPYIHYLYNIMLSKDFLPHKWHMPTHGRSPFLNLFLSLYFPQVLLNAFHKCSSIIFKCWTLMSPRLILFPW